MATTPVFLPGEYHGQRSLAGSSPWDHKGSDIDRVTEHTRWIYFFCFGFDIFDGIFVVGPFGTSLKNNLTLLSGNIVTFIFNVI